MIVREYEFEKTDPRNSNYSLVEADIYGWTLKIILGYEVSERLHYWRTPMGKRGREVKRGRLYVHFARALVTFTTEKPLYLKTVMM